MDDFEFLLEDRIAKIQAINKEYDLEHNAYISFSGGKDSTILHYLIDLALPNNQIPRVFINTGIEYVAITQFVKKIATQDSRFEIYNSGVNIKKMLEKYGYPFKSKEHAKKVDQYWRTKELTHYLKMYIDKNDNGKFKASKSKYKCPNQLLYQFTPENKLHISHLCCHKLKKEPIKKWMKENGKEVCLTGMRAEEGGQRANINCVIVKNGNLKSFHPLLVVSEEWEEEFIKRYNVQLCKLYYPPYNFVRTGCKGCPFALSLQEQLDKMEDLLPNERKQCEAIWKPVYDEYRRIGYRLRKKDQARQLSLEDIMGE